MQSTTKNVPAGGPGTINGILYQLLWSLASLGGFRASAHRILQDQLDQITLIVEPSTGGDHQVISPTKRVVEQLKARSDGDTWSLQAVLCDVLPDLYLAVDETKPDTEFRFVTEGRLGNWSKAEAFFRSLPPVPAETDVLAELSDDVADEIKFGRRQTKKPFWEPGLLTPRKLFRKIVETLRRRPAISSEPFEQTCRTTWTLLRGFRFEGGIKHAAVRNAVDTWLLAQIGSADRLEQIRDNLLLELGRMACGGNAVVDASTFFKSNGLDGTPLTKWTELSANSRHYLDGVLWRKQEEVIEDVRPSLTAELLEGWSIQCPILAITGESGTGKTWHGFQSLICAAESGDVVIHVEAVGDADRDLDKAARIFWGTIKGADESPPLERLRARLRQVDKDNASRRLTLLVDNVVDTGEARRLIEADWEGWGVRLVMTCSETVAEAIRRAIGARGRVAVIEDFTHPELQQYLQSVVGVDWERIRFDVQKIIRRPLLARLFREIVSGDGWVPVNEYSLFERSWDDLPKRDVQAMDLDSIRRLAAKVLLDECPYPWPISTLRQEGIDSDTLARLVKAGWLRESEEATFEIWHDRLLNWTVAEAVATSLRHGTPKADAMIQTVVKLLADHRIKCGRMLGYVPMDLLWLLLDPRSGSSAQFAKVIKAYENQLGKRGDQVLYRELLPTLGERIVPFLTEKLRTGANTIEPYILDHILEGINEAGGQQCIPIGMTFLCESSPKVRRMGVCLLHGHPSANALDTLWTLHVDAMREPEPYLWFREHKYGLREDTFGALRKCVVLDPAWLERKISDADPSCEPIYDLAYLVANVGDAALWNRCKKTLMSKMDENHPRSIATCIQIFRDREEIDWLEKLVGSKVDLVGPVALKALALIDPERAIRFLGNLDDIELYMTREWTFGSLYLRVPEKTMAHLAARLREHTNPWQYATVLQGKEDAIDSESLDFLLDRFVEMLELTAKSATPREITTGFRQALGFINAVAKPALLERLRCRRNTALTKNLADWLITVGPQEGQFKDHDKSDALAALAKIGGDHFSRALEDWLEHGDWYAHSLALKVARRRITPRTTELLTKLVHADGPADEGQRKATWGYAAAALAAHECWLPMANYHLRVGSACLMQVEECCPEPSRPVGDAELGESYRQIKESTGPSVRAIFAVALARRTDLLPDIRAAFRLADPSSNVALACLVAFDWLVDQDVAMVPLISRCLDHWRPYATNALLANGSAAAYAVLLAHLRVKKDPGLAAILANKPVYRSEAVAVIAESILAKGEIRSPGGLVHLVQSLHPDVLSEVSSRPDVISYAEEMAYGDYGNHCVVGVKAAALLIVGQNNSEGALRIAASRLRDSETPDGESYIPVIGQLFPTKAAGILLDAVVHNPPTRIVYEIGRYLRNLDALPIIVAWFSGTDAERRIAACRVLGFQTPTAELEAKVRVLIDDPDNQIVEAATEAAEFMRKSQITQKLVSTFVGVTDNDFRWCLLDGLVEIGDLGGVGLPPQWFVAIRDRVSPVMRKYISEQLKKRSEKEKRDLDWADKGRRS